jgi:hypothetical protein
MGLIKAIGRANQLARMHRAALNKVSDLFLERYGAQYNDIDCDPMIDICDCGIGFVPGSLKSLDAIVLEYNELKPIRKKKK